MKHVAKLAAATVLACIAAAGTARADVITQVVSTGDYNAISGSGSATYASFDSSLGTLTSVTASIGKSVTASGAVFDFGSFPYSSSYGLQDTSKISFNGGVLQALSATGIGTGTDFTVQPGQSVPIAASSTNALAGDVALPLSPFSGTGRGLVIFADTVQQRSDSGAEVTGGYNSVITSDQLELAYTYTPIAGASAVPEPSAALLLGTALLVVPVLTRKRRAE